MNKTTKKRIVFTIESIICLLVFIAFTTTFLAVGAMIETLSFSAESTCIALACIVFLLAVREFYRIVNK